MTETFDCDVCKKNLDPRKDAIVYLQLVKDGLCFALCAPTPEQVNSCAGSPCVRALRLDAELLGETLVPSDEETYLSDRFPPSPI